MAMISGMQAKRVRKPTKIKAAQKNSAKMTSDMEVTEPILNGSVKVSARDANLVNLAYPCGIIKAPSPIRNIKVAMVNEAAEYLVLNSFFMYIG